MEGNRVGRGEERNRRGKKIKVKKKDGNICRGGVEEIRRL